MPTHRATTSAHNHSRQRRAFTLVEVMLAIALLVMLLGVFAISAVDRPDSIAFEEGVSRFESMIRVMRAEAANKGRRFRLTFAEGTEDAAALRAAAAQGAATFAVEWEPQPLAQPGEYLAWTDASWTPWVPTESVLVERCALTGDSAYQTLVYDSSLPTMKSSSEQQLDTITFHPDGASDSATIELVPVDANDTRHAVIDLDGINGLITSRILSKTEWQQYLENAEELP